VTTVPSAEPGDRWPVPPLFDHLVDDSSLLQPRAEVPSVDEVVTRYLTAREGRYGGLLGQLACPVSRLPMLVKELARSGPTRPVELALVVDSGLGAVPKALSAVFSRSSLLTLRTIEAAAPVDVDSVWLERVAEFVPDEVVPVVEPRRPIGVDDAGVDAWLHAVRRVAEHGCVPKLRCGPRPSDVPTVADVARFVRIVVDLERRFVVLGLEPVAHTDGAGHDDLVRHGVLNLLVAVGRALDGGDVADALGSADGTVLAQEALGLSPARVRQVRALLARCGTVPDPAPTAELATLGLLG
jgi:hypothetical protein